jgi:prolyl-tRNA synthetase
MAKQQKDNEKAITPRAEDYGRWYTDVIAAAELADYSPVRGCMVIRPHGYAIWENIQRQLDAMIKATGHQNAYFPLFIPESFMTKEAEHVEGFAPQCAVVTHGGGSELEEKLYIRPTSETIMYHMYAKWIQSWRDLPLLLNQWANVVRWEMRTRLFLRTTEFLWQEGHTAHATKEEAEAEALTAAGMYRDFAQDWMAMPVLDGPKSDAERFAGAETTYCIEAMMQDTKALQAGTSHMLGQNFAKAFDVQFQDQNGERQYVWQTSWGVSTRLVGGIIMTHSDDTGLVLPPRLAPIQVVIVPIARKPENAERMDAAITKLVDQLRAADVERVKVDDRDSVRPGAKFFEWERKGVPVRVEIGPRDLDGHQLVAGRRDTGEKQTIGLDDAAATIAALLETIQGDLFAKALALRQDNTRDCDDYAEFQKLNDEIGGFFNMHWCGSPKCEAEIKTETQATVRVMPFAYAVDPGPCIKCGAHTDTKRAVFAKSY